MKISKFTEKKYWLATPTKIILKLLSRTNVLSHVDLWGMVVGSSGAKIAIVNGLSILSAQADSTNRVCHFHWKLSKSVQVFHLGDLCLCPSQSLAPQRSHSSFMLIVCFCPLFKKAWFIALRKLRSWKQWPIHGLLESRRAKMSSIYNPFYVGRKYSLYSFQSKHSICRR